jgi:hypothetical protein
MSSWATRARSMTSPVSASRTISRPHSDRGRALLSELALNSGEHRLAVGVDGVAVERGIQLAARSLRTRTGRHEHADTDASSDGEATLRSGVANDLYAGTTTRLSAASCTRALATASELVSRWDARTLKQPQEKGDKKAMGADLHADRIHARPPRNALAKPIRGCVLEPKRPRFLHVAQEVREADAPSTRYAESTAVTRRRRRRARGSTGRT